MKGVPEPPNGARLCLMTLFVFCCCATSADLGMRDTGRQQLYLANRPPLVSASILLFPRPTTECLSVPLNPFPWNEPARCCTVNASCKTKDSSSSPVESGVRAWKKRFRGHGLPQEHSMCPINVTARLSVCRDFIQNNRREWIFLDIFGGALRLKK